MEIKDIKKYRRINWIWTVEQHTKWSKKCWEDTEVGGKHSASEKERKENW